jgi:hypothetical protein
MSNKSQFLKDAHKEAKRQKRFYGKSRTYRQLLGEVLTASYRSLRKVVEIVTVAVMDAFESVLSYKY